jgi:hypothetical protein
MAHEGGVQVLEDRFLEWRSYVRRRQAIDAPDVDELEDHLRSQVADLQEAGLDPEEAFLIGVKRLGELDALSREFAREHSERLWKRLVVADAEHSRMGWSREALVALGLAVAAALAVKVPELFGLGLDGSPAAESFYVRNVSLLVLPFLAGFFAWKRGLTSSDLLRLAAPFLAGALAMNLYPFMRGGSTEILAAVHLPIALWFAVGFGYAGGAWRSHDQRMNFVRFSGEWLIYFVLIGLGGGVLMMFTMFIFGAIGLDAEWLLESWILPCGAAGAVVVAGWLVEAKQSVIENMAPVLTMLFTPLFTLMLLVFLVTIVWTGSGIAMDARAGDLCPPGERPGSLGHPGAHLRIRLQPQQGGRAWRESRPRGESRLVRRALREVPAWADGLRTTRALADGVPARVRRVGVDRGADLPAGVRFPVEDSRWRQ